MNWEAVGVFVGLLTIAAGLAGPVLVGWWQRPRLRAVSGADADHVLAASDDGHGRTACWLRLPVYNAGRSTAQDVSVIFHWVRIEGAPPGPAPRRPPSRECKWADLPPDQVTLALPPATSRLVDVVHVVTLTGAGGRRSGLVAGVVPLGDWDTSQPGSPLWLDLVAGVTVTVAVSVMATNAAARKYHLTFRLADPGDPDQVRRSLAAAAPVLHTDREALSLV